MIKELKKFIRIINTQIKSHAPYFQSYTERIEELKKSAIHIDIVSDSFKLDGYSKFSSFRGIIHYLDKNGEWTFTDTGTYPNIFECIQEAIEDAEHIKDNWL